MEVEKVLNRSQYNYLLDNNNFIELVGKKILITGSNGSIGTRLRERFNIMKVDYVSTDIEDLDLTDECDVRYFLKNKEFDIIINIAGAKHAPKGEVEVSSTLDINTIGVINLIKYKNNAKLVLASTCKSCNPETVYGSTKLISERLVMNNGGSVARFYNVIETSGNVFEIWKDKETIEVVSKCNRYFISLNEAVGLLMYTCLNKGRYSVNVDVIHNMMDIANRLYPSKTKLFIEPRKGDRITELKYGSNEQIQVINESIIKVKNYFDEDI